MYFIMKYVFLIFICNISPLLSVGHLSLQSPFLRIDRPLVMYCRHVGLGPVQVFVAV